MDLTDCGWLACWPLRISLYVAAASLPRSTRSSVGNMIQTDFGPNVCISSDVHLGERVRLAPFVNLYGCRIGDDTRIGAFVEVQKDARIGSRCKISTHTFICTGVSIEDEVFIGHGVLFINDRRPRATNDDGTPQVEEDWELEPTIVHKRASI